MSNNVLIVFMSCKKNKNLWKKLLNSQSNSIIFYADPNLNKSFTFKNRILTLKCGDTYECLPEKVYNMINSILLLDKYNQYSHILKIDDWDTKLINNFNKVIKNFNLTDYCGPSIHYKNNNTGNRLYHIGRCDPKSKWNNTIYKGNFCPYLAGGASYILSKKAMRLLSNENLTNKQIYKKNIYEDVMISLLLKKHNIYPYLIKFNYIKYQP